MQPKHKLEALTSKWLEEISDREGSKSLSAESPDWHSQRKTTYFFSVTRLKTFNLVFEAQTSQKYYTRHETYPSMYFQCAPVLVLVVWWLFFFFYSRWIYLLSGISLVGTLLVSHGYRTRDRELSPRDNHTQVFCHVVLWAEQLKISHLPPHNPSFQKAWESRVNCFQMFLHKNTKLVLDLFTALNIFEIIYENLLHYRSRKEKQYGCQIM